MVGVGVRVAVLPLVGGDDGGGVRRVLERVVLLGELAALDLRDLLADVDHGLAEAVELRLVLTLGGLDHDGAFA